MQKIIHLISGPRNISTALMYSFGNRLDTAIIDEPFYAAYLYRTNIDYHPGKEEIINSQNINPLEVITNDILPKRKEEYLFVKNMAHHLQGFDYSFCYRISNIFLIRNPKQLLTSFAKVIKNPSPKDIGIEHQVTLYNEIKNVGGKAIVLDAGELLKNPIKILSLLCQKLDITWSPKMLSWSSGPKQNDGIWAKYWYRNVHNSTGFVKRTNPQEIKLDDSLSEVYEIVYPAYEQLYKHSIKA